MSLTVVMQDEALGGAAPSEPLRVEFASEHQTVRDLIRERVHAEVAAHNSQRAEVFRGLVQPTDSERALNGYRTKPGRMIDPEAQVARACEAFGRNGFFLIVDDKQAESLDDVVTLSETSVVSFLKLMPLVGG